MTFRSKLILTLIAFIVMVVAYNNIFSNKMISGKYIYSFPDSNPEGPREGDYLKLEEDGTFKSDTWGEGTYKISGNEIHFSYEHGRAGYHSYVDRYFFFGAPRLMVDLDMNYYFEKTSKNPYNSITFTP